MKKTLATLSTTALLLGGLVACNTKEEAMDTRYEDNTQPIGYYSNENIGNDRNGNGYMMDDNDGPVTEFMDRNGTNIGMRDNALRNGNLDNAGVGLQNRDQNGRLFNNQQNDGQLSKQISDRVAKVNNVDDVRTLVNGDTILIAVDTNDQQATDRVEDEVRQAVKSLANGKNIRVITDEGIFTRVRTIDNDLRDGGRTDQVNNDIEDLFDNIGDALNRPFNNR